MFKLEFRTDNAAFAENYTEEVARILTVTAMRVKGGNLEGRCLDINGNHVGNFRFSPDGE